MKRLAAALALVILVSGARAEESALDVLLGKVKKAMADVKTTRGRFKQTKRLAVFDDTVESTGTFAIRRPDRLRWEVQKPFKSVIVIAGEKGARWNETRKSVERFALADKPGIDIAVKQLFTWYSGNFDEVKGPFEASVDKDGRTVVLTPKSDKLKDVMSRISIKLSANLSLIESIVLDEKGGDRTDIVFEGVEVNAELADPVFQLED